MRKVLLGVAALGLTAVAWAGPTRIDPSQVHLTPLSGTNLGAVSSGNVSGFAYQFDPVGGSTRAGLHLYDNNITTGTVGTGPFATFIFLDWVGTTAAMGDDLHSVVPGTVTHIHYLFLNTVGTSTHLIKMHAQVSPSAPHAPGTMSIGGTIASFSVAGLPTGAFSLSIGGLSIPVTSAAWISFNDPGGLGAFNTFWGTGGNPGIGYSHDGLNYQTLAGGFNYWVAGPFGPFLTGGGGFVSAVGNVMLALGAIPEPATIGALALCGLLVLRRRRA